MTINFVVKDKHLKKDTDFLTIKCLLLLNSKRKTVNTNLKIQKKDWLGGKTLCNNKVIKNELQKYEHHFNDYINNCVINDNSKNLNDASDYMVNLKINQGVFLVYDYNYYFEKFISYKRTMVKANTLKTYDYTILLLNKYIEFKKIDKFRVKMIDSDFVNDFVQYLISKNIANSSIKNVITQFITTIKWINEKYKTQIPPIIKPKLKNDTNNVLLDETQLTKYKSYKFKNNRINIARDMAIFSLQTGLRYSDLINIKKSNVKNNILTILIKKTCSLVNVTLNKDCIKILERNNYNLKYKDGIIYPSLLSYYIQRGLKIIGCDEDIETYRYVGNEVMQTTKCHYETISIHDFRRMFITTMVNKKVPINVIMTFTGHKNVTTLNSYYTPNVKEQAKFIKDVNFYD